MNAGNQQGVSLRSPIDRNPLRSTPGDIFRALSPQLRLVIASTLPPTRCGIADYTHLLATSLRRLFGRAPEFIELQKPNIDNPIWYWRKNETRPIDVMHIQHEYGLFGSTGLLERLQRFRFVRDMTDWIKGCPGLKSLAYFLYYIIPSINTVIMVSGARRRSGACVVLTMHTVMPEDRGWPCFLFEQLVARSVDKVIVHTRAAKRSLVKRGLAAAHIAHIPHGVSQQLIGSVPVVCPAQLQGKPIIMMFGFIAKYKNHAAVIQALSDLDPSTGLWIAGTHHDRFGASYHASLRRLAHRLRLSDRVVFGGYIPHEEIPGTLEFADIVVFPYAEVTQSGALQLALACRRVILCSDLEPFEDLRRRYGCLETFRLNDPADLRFKLARLLSDQALRVRLLAGGARYLESHSWDRVAERTERLYANVARRPATRAVEPFMVGAGLHVQQTAVGSGP